MFIFQIPGESISFVKELTNQETSKIPDTITFQCELSNAGLEVTWYKGEKALRKSDKYQVRFLVLVC